MVPYRTALVPDARVAAMPPREASAPGSMGKNSPLSRRYSLSCLRVTPGWTVTSRSSERTASTAFMPLTSMQTPPFSAATWPSSEVPVPKAMTGTPCAAQAATASLTSAVLRANTTASGGQAAKCDSSLP